MAVWLTVGPNTRFDVNELIYLHTYREHKGQIYAYVVFLPNAEFVIIEPIKDISPNLLDEYRWSMIFGC